jgi:hypothetical protein
MILLLLVNPLLLVLMLVAMKLTSPTQLSSALKFVLSSLVIASDEQYESIPDDDITLLARKFCVLHRFRKEGRRSPRDFFDCSDTIHFITDCPNRKKFDSSNKYDFTKRNDYNKDDDKNYHFRDKKKKFQKMMSRVYAAFSDLDFSSDDSYNSEEDEKLKHKQCNFNGLCLMEKSSRHISDSDVSDDLSFESLSLRVVELENALCNQGKLLCKIFCENKKLNLELESASSEITSLRSVHDDMSAKPYENYTMIMVNYAELWLMHSQVASLLDGVRLELRELKARSTLLDACTTCPLLRSNLNALVIEIKNLKHKLDHSSRYSILSPLCDACGSLKGKIFYAIKENTDLPQEITYLTAHLEKIGLSEKIIEDDLSQIEDSATKSTYKLGIGFERCEDKSVKSIHKFIPSSTYHKEEVTIKPTKSHYPSNPKSSFNPKREVSKETPKLRDEAFVCIF